jgi:glycosyltransferase involved in cell wall biosynthesis
LRGESLSPHKEPSDEVNLSDPICVITPCYNAAPFLLSCLHSVSDQGSCVSRHIVMDGGSTDGCVEILREYSHSSGSLLWRSERDSGQSDALNKALELVNTQYFAWLNADDCFIPGTLPALVSATEALPSPSIVYGDYQVIDSAGMTIKFRRQPSFNYWDCLYSYLTVQNCAALFRTDLCRAMGGFDRELVFCMDYDLILRLGRIGPVRHVREYVGCFRHHAGAKTSRLPRVCEVETERLRLKASGLSASGLRWRYWIAKMRVAGRMLMEGCIPSRMRRGEVAPLVTSS